MNHRSVFLAAFGAAWVVYGVSLLIADPSRPVTPLLTSWGYAPWGWSFTAAGGVALAAAVVRPGRDGVGFAALSLIATSRVVDYILDFLATDFEATRSLAIAAVWAAVTTAIAITGATPTSDMKAGR